MSKIGKKQHDKNYEKFAERAINESGYTFLHGFYYYLLTSVAYTTAWNYTYQIIKFLDDERIHYPEEINLDNYVYHLASLKDTSQSSIILAYSAMKKFSKYLYANEIAKKNYMDFVERPKVTETQEQIDKREAGFLTKKQCLDVFRKIDEYDGPKWIKIRDRAMLSVFLGTGIRRAALYKLDINDFNFEDNTIVVDEKGEKNRKIQCPEKTMMYIKEWFEYRNKMVGENEPAAFISKEKKRISMNCISKITIKYTGKTPHKLRGTFGTEVYAKTKDLYLTQECMGHSSPKTTEIYIRGRKAENSRKAAEIMGKLIG